MRCARCGAEGQVELVELHRYGAGGATVAEVVCPGCCTRIEAAVCRRVAEPDLIAFMLALTDAVDRLHASKACRA